MSGICYIAGAGEHFSNDFPAPDNNDIVIAADGGYNFLRYKKIKADIILGDFDSVEGEIDFSSSQSAQIIKLNPVKDETDTLYAINKGIELGFSTFYIYGGTGGRTDHTFANIQSLLMLAKKGLTGYLFAENEIMTVIHNSTICFDQTYQGNVSAFSLDTVSYGVTETGLKYLLDNYEMSNSYPIGVSNEFTGLKSSISVKNGTLLIIFPKSTNMPEIITD